MVNYIGLPQGYKISHVSLVSKAIAYLLQDGFLRLILVFDGIWTYFCLVYQCFGTMIVNPEREHVTATYWLVCLLADFSIDFSILL